MEGIVAINEVINELDAWQLVDVRSPEEFAAGHIPGAINIPLFSDEERAIVGTLYKQTSPEAALREGLSIAGKKMASLVDAIKPLSHNGERRILVHCWRGGKRSKAVEWLFNFSGISVYRLEGGYKQFRTALQSYFLDERLQLKILGGCTGAGKTEVLQALAARGEQVIDLERLAHHKGSAFGAIGENDQPSTEQFENKVFLSFLSLDLTKPIWLENESRSIGKVYLPEGLWRKMRLSVLYTIEVEKLIRLQRALRYYSEPVDFDLLKMSFDKIKKRLGGLDYQLAVQALEKKDLHTAAAIALDYYDKSYTFQIGNWAGPKVVELKECGNIMETAERLMMISNGD